MTGAQILSQHSDGEKLKVLSLFAGIGGFDLGLERTGGFETVAFCEIEEFPRRVLAKHWPHVPCYRDVRELTGAILAADGIAGIDVITGGFPCQDLSSAGKRAGIGNGTRSGLYAEVLRLACDLRPSFIILENVAGLLSGPSEQPGGWFGRVLGDLASIGYDAEWENIPASALGAPHRRERVWVVAYPSQNDDAQFPCVHCSRQNRLLGNCCEAVANACHFDGKGEQPSQSNSQEWPRSFLRPVGPCSDGSGWWQTEPDVGRVANGVSSRAHRLAALGNAVVPQIPELIGHAILNSLPRIPARKPGGVPPSSSATGQHFTNTPTALSSFDRDGGVNGPDALSVNSGRSGGHSFPLNLAPVTSLPASIDLSTGAGSHCGGVGHRDCPAAVLENES